VPTNNFRLRFVLRFPVGRELSCGTRCFCCFIEREPDTEGFAKSGDAARDQTIWKQADVAETRAQSVLFVLPAARRECPAFTPRLSKVCTFFRWLNELWPTVGVIPKGIGVPVRVRAMFAGPLRTLGQ